MLLAVLLLEQSGLVADWFSDSFSGVVGWRLVSTGGLRGVGPPSFFGPWGW